MSTALFPGTFRPFTIGHAAIADRALTLFDRLVIAVGVNAEKENDDDDAASRVAAIRGHYAGNDRVTVLAYRVLTADLVKETGACCIVRGIRDEKDLLYENEMTRANATLFGVETVYLLADTRLRGVSSSLVRELQRYGKDVSELLPDASRKIREK